MLFNLSCNPLTEYADFSIPFLFFYGGRLSLIDLGLAPTLNFAPSLYFPRLGWNERVRIGNRHRERENEDA